MSDDSLVKKLIGDSPLVPEWDELWVPEDDSAEPDDADVEHKAPAEEDN